ncbi:CHAT domain-containing protein [Collybia nuda]|uniref:CHAT domain-containing protein n=1 Tax=Collybia nuda TaxID=64659 RepID=A0A9P5XS78_9AGAR|nr:CHAT domain-containing protein [Collybia nuda]
MLKTTWGTSKRKLTGIQTSMKIKLYDKQIHDYYKSSQPDKVAHIEQKLNFIVPDDLGYADAQAILGDFFLTKYLEDGGREAIDKSIVYYSNSVRTTVPGLDQVQRKHNLGTVHGRRFQKFGDLTDLTAALTIFQETVDATPLNDASLIGRQNALAVAYTDRFYRLGELDDLERAFSLYKTILDSTSPSDPSLLHRQKNMVQSYANRYKRLGNLDDLESVLKLRHTILDSTPAGDASLPDSQQGLAMAYTDRYKKLDDLKDLEMALNLLHSALDNTPAGGPHYAGKQQALGSIYGDRYQRLGNLQDLQTALDLFQKSFSSTPPDHPDLAMRQQNLAAAYADYYRRLGNTKDLDAALHLFRNAIDASPQEHSGLPGRQHNLAGLYVDRFRRFGQLNDLGSALILFQSAIDGTPIDHPEKPWIQHDLAVLYGDRYQRLGNLEDLEHSISLDQSSVVALSKSHPNIATIQHSLSVSYTDRFTRLGNLVDLEGALIWGQRAIDSTVPDHPELPRRQFNLAGSYSNRYRRLGNMEDLETALKFKKAALDGALPGHPELPKTQQSLAGSYEDRFDKLNNMEDFENALNLQLLALNGTPNEHPDFPVREENLAGIYKKRYKMKNNIEDLQAALSLLLDAANIIPFNHPHLCKSYRYLAQTYIDLYKHSESQDYLEQALDAGIKSIHSDFASPISIWHAAQSMAIWATELKHPISLQAYSAAFNIIPEMLWVGHSIDARHETLVQENVAQLSASAVQAAIYHDELHLAVEFFEQGLAITHQQLLQLKNNNLLLFEQFPDIGSKLKNLSWQLLNSKVTVSESTIPEMASLNVIADKRNNLIKEIRKLPGFSRFLLPPLFKDLAQAAQHGPIVILNCGAIQSDAIIIFPPSSSQAIKHILLSQITLAHAHAQLDKLRLALSSYRIGTRAGRLVNPFQKNDEIFASILAWLWAKIVQPVFEELREGGVDRGRIWWCPSGPFTYLPIHAAAPVNSQYIQSYTLTLQNLIQDQSKLNLGESRLESFSLTAVGVSNYPINSHTNLPLVKAELIKAEKFCTSSSSVTFTKYLDSDATVANVMQHIQSSQWLHIACHGQQNHSEPLRSGLLLYDGDLELKQIIDMNLSSSRGEPKFVFLSACQTAMGNEKLANEAMHLAGGFIAAGFRGAIGTLWNMADADGPKVAESVYQKVFGRSEGNSSNTPDITLAAEGLQEAIRKLRTEKVPYHHWIPYIHFGI